MSYPKVTIVGAGQVGATAAHLILMHEIADVVLIDVAEGLPQGKALDMMHMRSIEGFGPKVIGTNDYADTAGSDIVVITAGVARKPGMTREDLLEINSKVITSVIEQAVEQSPDAIFICVTNPLDVMTYLAAKTSGLPKNRIFGMGGVLDTARFIYSISEATGAEVDDIEAICIGAHGEAMVPVPSLVNVNEQPLTEVLSPQQIDEVCKRTVGGGAEVVSLLKTGSAYYAPGASVARMVWAILEESEEILSVCAYLDGEYGVRDLYMCVPVVLDRTGVAEIVELDLSDKEQEALVASANSIASAVDSLGLRD